MDTSQYVRVSTLLSQIKSLSHIDPIVLQKKADLGTAVHDAIHVYLTQKRKRKIFTDDKERGYLDSYLIWHSWINPKYTHLETRLFDHSLRFTGQFDGLAYVGGKLCLIDFKCTSEASHETWPLQGTFYHHLVDINEMISDPIDRYLFIQLRPQGTAPIVHTYYPSQDKRDFCLSLAKKYWNKVDEITTKCVY